MEYDKGCFIYFYDGFTWARQYRIEEFELYDIAASDADHVWAITSMGQIHFGTRE